MSNRSFDEKYFDDMLKHVILDIEDDDVGKSEELYHQLKDLPPTKTSFRHRWKMKHIIKSFDNADTGIVNHRPVRRLIVTATAMLVIISTTGLFASADLRELFQRFGFFTTDYFDVSLSEDYTNKIIEETKAWKHGDIYVPELIPNGYALDSINVGSNQIIFEYKTSEDENMTYSMTRIGHETIITTDKDEAVVKKIKIGGYDAIYVETGKDKSVQYNSNTHLFFISSNSLGENELIRVAESIETIENIKF